MNPNVSMGARPYMKMRFQSFSVVTLPGDEIKGSSRLGKSPLSTLSNMRPREPRMFYFCNTPHTDSLSERPTGALPSGSLQASVRLYVSLAPAVHSLLSTHTFPSFSSLLWRRHTFLSAPDAYCPLRHLRNMRQTPAEHEYSSSCIALVFVRSFAPSGPVDST